MKQLVCEMCGEEKMDKYSFTLILENTYYKTGFFNIKKKIDNDNAIFFGSHEESIEILCENNPKPIIGKINRTANTNGTPRIMGGEELKLWFQKKSKIMGKIKVEIISRNKIYLRAIKEPVETDAIKPIGQVHQDSIVQTKKICKEKKDDLYMVNNSNRGKILSENFKEFWIEFFKNRNIENVKFDDIELSFKECIDLKNAIKDVNNIATYKVTLLLVDEIVKILPELKSDEEEIKNYIEKKSSNSNGYDIEHDGKVRFIAEVKCSKPINDGNKFGPDQREGIIEDINSLCNKTKSRINHQDYYKFLGIYKYEKAEEAINNLVKNRKEWKGKVELYKLEEKLDKNKVYIIMINEPVESINKESNDCGS